jgi:hypothetical protein
MLDASFWGLVDAVIEHADWTAQARLIPLALLIGWGDEGEA